MRPEMRRTMTLSEQLATPDPAIRDFLKIPQDDAAPDEGGSITARDHAGAGGGGGMMYWKPLRDRLRLRRAANAWLTPHAPNNKAGGSATTTTANNNSRSNKYNYSPGEAAAAFSRTFSRAPSLRTTPTFSRVGSTRVGPNNSASSRSSGRRPAAAAHEPRNEDHMDDDHHDDNGGEDDEEENDDEEEQGKKEEAPAAQMSLMALLEQSDDWDSDDEEEGGGEARKNGGGAAGDDDDDDGEAREEEMVHVCCVCMVRHKGAAFIPCGHTFCRLCSRELWVSRTNCPLCNGFIQEILDIF